MKTTVPHLWMPRRVGQREIASRLVLPPMASATADAAGVATEATYRHYERIVSACHGLAFVEYTFVQAHGRSEANQLGLTSDRHASALAELVQRLRRKGALIGLQLTHAGGKTEAGLIGQQPLGPSDVAVPAVTGEMPPPRPMTPAEIAELLEAFVTAARQAEAIGFHAIEIHAAHGYFFNQWLSPITNRRSDDHGGSLAARAGLLLSLLRRLRRELRSETILSLRFPAQDRLPGGLSLADGQQLARWVQAAGADLLNVSSGLGGWRRQRDQRGEGYLVPDAAAIRQATDLPVVGVGGIESRAYVDDLLATGKVDLVAVGRAILANPDWPCQAMA